MHSILVNPREICSLFVAIRDVGRGHEVQLTEYIFSHVVFDNQADKSYYTTCTQTGQL